MINKRLINLIGNCKKYIALNVIFQLINLLLNIIAIFSMSNIIERVYNKNIVKDDLIKLSLIILSIIILKFIFNILIAKMSYYSSGRVKQILREKIYSKLLTLGSKYREKFSTSEIVQISMEGVDQLEIYFAKYLPQFFYSIIAPIVLFIILSFVSFKSAVILLICVPLIPISIIAIVKIAKKILKKYWGSYTDLGHTFLEDIQGLTTLKIYKADEKKNEEMNIEAENFRIATMNLLYMQLNSITVMDIIAYGGASLGVIISISEFIKGNINLASTFSVIMLSAEFFIPLRLLGSFFHIAMNGISASEKMFQILDIKDNDNRINNINRENETITFRDVSFKYYEDKIILKNINMTIKEKSFVSIVGVSGCGKSTIASLISLKNENYNGSIKIGNIELSSIDKNDLNKRIVVVDHNSYLFEGTVYDNLIMARDDISEYKMNEALKQVELYDFLQSENGLNTKIMEKAANLSGGQKQRLALARAILYDGDIYIFDEATSNVDVESEDSIMKVIREIAKEKTVILISHRLYNSVLCDYIYFLNNGIIEEEGSHNKLMSLNGKYSKLYNEQKSLESITRMQNEFI